MIASCKKNSSKNVLWSWLCIGSLRFIPKIIRSPFSRNMFIYNLRSYINWSLGSCGIDRILVCFSYTVCTPVVGDLHYLFTEIIVATLLFPCNFVQYYVSKSLLFFHVDISRGEAVGASTTLTPPDWYVRILSNSIILCDMIECNPNPFVLEIHVSYLGTLCQYIYISCYKYTSATFCFISIIKFYFLVVLHRKAYY